MNPDTVTLRSSPPWPRSLERVGAVRFARRSFLFDETVEFYRDLVRLPILETFEDSYSTDGVIFGLPNAALTFEVVQSEEPVVVGPHEQICLYFPDEEAKEAAQRNLVEAGIEPVPSHPYWRAHGAVTYRDPEGREIVLAPFIYGGAEPIRDPSHEAP